MGQARMRVFVLQFFWTGGLMIQDTVTRHSVNQAANVIVPVRELKLWNTFLELCLLSSLEALSQLHALLPRILRNLVFNMQPC